MKIYKIIADERPSCCMFCPIARQQKGKCGEMVTENNNGWESRYKAPDRRCLFEIRKVGEENANSNI